MYTYVRKVMHHFDERVMATAKCKILSVQITVLEKTDTQRQDID